MADYLLCPFVIELIMHMYIIITNNPLTANNAGSGNVLRYCEGADIMDVLLAVRGQVHHGHKLATHPLTSSIKPNETPYKTVLLCGRKEALCPDSLDMVESAVRVSERFLRQNPPRSWSNLPAKVLEDLAVIDYDMIKQWIN